MSFDKKKTAVYLAVTFAAAWVLQFIASRAGAGIMQIVLVVVMYMPFLGALAAKAPLRGMGWHPNVKGNGKYIAAAWLMPALLTTVGAALYFAVFPAHFDLTGAYLSASAGESAMAALEAQGLTYPMYVLISVVSAVTYAPLLNTFAAIGEEVGWRGFLYPQLKARFGITAGRLLGGVIWGAWHFPLIALIGYEYGTAYWGFPITGMLIFCVFTVAIGIICDWLYEKSGSIWLPALAHGATNAAATVPLAVMNPEFARFYPLGSAPNGLIAGLPIVILAAVILAKDGQQE